MFIRTEDGGILNLLKVENINVVSGNVAAWTRDDSYHILFAGTDEQCMEYIDFLYGQLNLDDKCYSTMPVVNE